MTCRDRRSHAEREKALPLHTPQPLNFEPRARRADYRDARRYTQLEQFWHHPTPASYPVAAAVPVHVLPAGVDGETVARLGFGGAARAARAARLHRLYEHDPFGRHPGDREVRYRRGLAVLVLRDPHDNRPLARPHAGSVTRCHSGFIWVLTATARLLRFRHESAARYLQLARP